MPMTNQISRDELRSAIADKLCAHFGVTAETATDEQVFQAAAIVIREILSRLHTFDNRTVPEREVHYLSMEFLMGRSLMKDAFNLGIGDALTGALEDLGRSAADIFETEPDAGLGNGGLGRLAACFIDSLASLGVPAFGYGIQYKYGIFEQAFDKDGKQIEKPDYWLTNEEPWGHIDYNRSQKVSFGGEVVEENGKKVWKPAWSVRAVPVDYMVPGYASGRVNTLRLWSAKSYDEFDLLTFNKSEYLDAVKPQVEAENISKILYPEDSTKVGKELRGMMSWMKK